MRRLEYESETNPRRRCLHSSIVLVSIVTGLALFLMLIAQIVGLYFDEFEPVSFVLRIYILVLCALGILVELEWTSLAQSKILSIWIFRGLFYSFVGVLGLQQNRTAQLRDENQAADVMAIHFMNVVDWLMVGVGGLYFVMGALCLQFLYSRQRNEWDRKKERAGVVRETTAKYGDHPGAGPENVV